MQEQKQNEKSFYWYDFETFGLDPATDRPAQFAGCRTTLDFEPLGEGEIIYCKPPLDYLPSAKSVLITGITPQRCDQKGVVESEFASEVWERFNTPGTISLGYNTMRFDDDVCRFLFWRNFLDAYSHQWRDGCSRWDIYPLACAVWALRGSAMKWPLWQELAAQGVAGAEGKEGVCFKLEYLSKANHITHEHAHDALSDVEATMGLAKVIAQTEPRLWKWALENREKSKVEAALAAGPVLWVDPRFGQKRGFMKLVTMLAYNRQKKNEVFVWDLSQDPTELSKLSAEEWRERLLPNRETLDKLKAEGRSPLPIYRLQVNASPFVCGSLGVLSEERAARFGIDKAAALLNAAKVSENLKLLQGALMEASERAPLPTPTDVDCQLYSAGFPSTEDRQRMKRVREATPEELTSFVARDAIRFDNPIYAEMLFRYRGRNWPESLTPEEADFWRDFCGARIMGHVKGVRNLNKFQEELDQLQDNNTEDSEAVMALLEELYEWGEHVSAPFSGIYEEHEASS